MKRCYLVPYLHDPGAPVSLRPGGRRFATSLHRPQGRREAVQTAEAKHALEVERSIPKRDRPVGTFVQDLRAMQERTNQVLEALKQEQELDPVTASFPESTSLAVKETEDPCGSLIGKLLRQAEALEAIVHDISNLCDVTEAMCNAQQKQVVHLFVNLPVWSLPHELMASLCDE